MRWVVLASAIGLLGGCEVSAVSLGYGLGFNMASLVFIGRTPPDAVISALSGRDCNIVHIDNRRPYCAADEVPPAPPVACTASLGTVDCWQAPPRGQATLADQKALTPVQQVNLQQGWLGRQLGVDQP